MDNIHTLQWMMSWGKGLLYYSQQYVTSSMRNGHPCWCAWRPELVHEACPCYELLKRVHWQSFSLSAESKRKMIYWWGSGESWCLIYSPKSVSFFDWISQKWKLNNFVSGKSIERRPLMDIVDHCYEELLALRFGHVCRRRPLHQEYPILLLHQCITFGQREPESPLR